MLGWHRITFSAEWGFHTVSAYSTYSQGYRELIVCQHIPFFSIQYLCVCVCFLIHFDTLFKAPMLA